MQHRTRIIFTINDDREYYTLEQYLVSAAAKLKVTHQEAFSAAVLADI